MSKAYELKLIFIKQFMTLIISPDYHAVPILEKNGIRWIPPSQAKRQDIRPLRIGILNIMPWEKSMSLIFYIHWDFLYFNWSQYGFDWNLIIIKPGSKIMWKTFIKLMKMQLLKKSLMD